MENNEYINKRIYKPVPILDGIQEIKDDFEERIAQGDTTYGIENLERHVKCLRKMAENATATERQTIIQHLTNAVTTIQQMR